MEALEALITRRSTRNYRPDPVDPEKLAKILDAGRQAPSGGNNQTSHFFVIRSREVLDRLIRLAEAAFARMEADEHTYASLKHSITAAKKGGYVFCYNAPVLIAVANRRDYGNNIADCAGTRPFIFILAKVCLSLLASYILSLLAINLLSYDDRR